MNNLVFNTVADMLKTTIYAQDPLGQSTPIKVDSNSNLLVSFSDPITIGNSSLTVTGTVTVSEISTPVTIGNASLTVEGTVTVSEITSPVTIGNASLTVEGTVTVSEITSPVTIGNASLTVEGTVTVSEITSPVTIGNASLTVEGTVTIGASSFTSLTVSSQAISGTGTLFDDTDISTLKVASIFLYNETATPITVSLQISPTAGANYIDDPFFTDVVVDGNEAEYITVGNFAHYIRLSYDAGAGSTVSAYFQGQA